MSIEQESAQQRGGESCSGESICGVPSVSYISIGTIRVRANISNIADDVIGNIFFTPTKECSVSHAGKSYAAFLCADTKFSCGILAPYESSDGVSICVGSKFAGLIHAALQQTAVEIEVTEKANQSSPKDCKKREWCLYAITIPAGS